MGSWFYYSIIHESLQQFHRGIFQYNYTYNYECFARYFFDSSISFWGLACCTLAPWINVICNKEQKDSAINNDFLGPVICGGRFGFYVASHHLFWISKSLSLPDKGDYFFIFR